MNRAGTIKAGLLSDRYRRDGIHADGGKTGNGIMGESRKWKPEIEHAWPLLFNGGVPYSEGAQTGRPSAITDGFSSRVESIRLLCGRFIEEFKVLISSGFRKNTLRLKARGFHHPGERHELKYKGNQ